MRGTCEGCLVFCIGGNAVRALALDFGTSFGDGLGRARLGSRISLSDDSSRATDSPRHAFEQSHRRTDKAASSARQRPTTGKTESKETRGKDSERDHRTNEVSQLWPPVN